MKLEVTYNHLQWQGCAGDTHMSGLVLAAGLAALFVFPLVAYGVMWVTSQRKTSDRPEPPETNRVQRNIPGRNSGD